MSKRPVARSPPEVASLVPTISAGAGVELELPEIVEGHGQRAPLLRLQEAQAAVHSVLEDEYTPVQRGVESARVDVEILYAALDHVDAGLVLEQPGQLPMRG